MLPSLVWDGLKYPRYSFIYSSTRVIKPNQTDIGRVKVRSAHQIFPSSASARLVADRAAERERERERERDRERAERVERPAVAPPAPRPNPAPVPPSHNHQPHPPHQPPQQQRPPPNPDLTRRSIKWVRFFIFDCTFGLYCASLEK